MTQMENRIVLCRFKDGYGPVGAYFLHLKTYTQNANGENYEKKWYDQTKELVGEYIDQLCGASTNNASTPQSRAILARSIASLNETTARASVRAVTCKCSR